MHEVFCFFPVDISTHNHNNNFEQHFPQFIHTDFDASARIKLLSGILPWVPLVIVRGSTTPLLSTSHGLNPGYCFHSLADACKYSFWRYRLRVCIRFISCCPHSIFACFEVIFGKSFRIFDPTRYAQEGLCISPFTSEDHHWCIGGNNQN